MEQMINDYEAQLQKYYEIVNISSKELNLYISADYLKMMSSVRVAPSINVKLYLVIALVLFFVIGCCGAIVLGRLSDVVDYLLYTDKKACPTAKSSTSTSTACPARSCRKTTPALRCSWTTSPSFPSASATRWATAC